MTTISLLNATYIATPNGAQSISFNFTPGNPLVLEFFLSAATMTRDGNNLVLTLPDGKVTLNNFFVTAEDNQLPLFVLPDGSQVAGKELLAASGLDLSTVSEQQAEDSGSSNYVADAGELLTGVDRLDALHGKAQWGVKSAENTDEENSALASAKGSGIGSYLDMDGNGLNALAPLSEGLGQAFSLSSYTHGSGVTQLSPDFFKPEALNEERPISVAAAFPHANPATPPAPVVDPIHPVNPATPPAPVVDPIHPVNPITPPVHVSDPVAPPVNPITPPTPVVAPADGPAAPDAPPVVNNAPVASAVLSHAVEGGDTVYGDLSTSVRDESGDTHTFTYGPTITYTTSSGSCTISADEAGLELKGDGTWALDPGAALYQPLGKDAHGVISIDYTVTDNGGQSAASTLSIDIYGCNQAPVASTAHAEVTENAPLFNGDLNGSVVDQDAGDSRAFTYSSSVQFIDAAGVSHSVSASEAGLTLKADGSFSINPGANLYQNLPEGGCGSLNIGYTVTDGAGASSSSTLVIDMHGVNDAPVIRSTTDTAMSGDLKISGQLSDVDYGDTHTFTAGTITYRDGNGVSQTVTAAAAGLKFNEDGTWSLDPNKTLYQTLKDGDKGTLLVNYTVADNHGGSASSSLSLTVNGLTQYQARGVLYLPDANSSDSFSFNALRDNLPVEGKHNTSVSVSAADKHADYYNCSYDDSTGRISYTLTQAGKDALERLGGQSLYSYITVTVAGQSYNMQIVVTPGSSFNSSVQDASDLATGRLNAASGHALWGEWHSGNASGAASESYTASGSAGNDEFSFSGKAAGLVTAVSASTLSAGLGNDTMNIKATSSGDGATGIYNSLVSGGEGNNFVNIQAESLAGSGNVFSVYGVSASGAASSVNAGAGADNISISAKMASTSASGVAYGVYASGAAATISSGEGADKVNIEAANNGAGKAYGLFAGSAANSSVTVETGAGNDTLSIAAYSNNNTATGAYNSVVNVGSGDDTLSIWANSANNGATGIYNSQIDGGEGANSISLRAESQTYSSGAAFNASGMSAVNAKSSISTGSGADDISIIATMGANSTSGTAYGVYSSGAAATVSSGDGKDNITITAGNYNEGKAYGLFANSAAGSFVRVDAGAGDDTISINGRGNSTAGSYSMYGSGVNNLVQLIAGSGSDNVTLGEAYSSYSGGANYGVIALGDSIDSADTAGVNDINTLTMYGNLANSKIYGDAGKDNVNLSLYGSGTIAGVSSSTIALGEGDDSVKINANSYTNNASGVQNSLVDGGNGNNSITIDAAAQTGASSTCNAYGINASSAASTVSSGTGDDTVTITATSWASGSSSIAGGLYATSATAALSTGAGDDTINITAQKYNAGKAYGMYAGSSGTVLLDSGDGDDKISISGSANTAANSYAMSGSSSSSLAKLIAGAGSDTITLSGLVNYSQIGLGKSTTAADTRGYADANRLTVTDDATNTKIYGDAGNDQVSLTGKTSSVTLDAGAGYDVLTLDLSGVSTKSNFTGQYGTLGTAAGLAAAGFEHLQVVGAVSTEVANYLNTSGTGPDWAQVISLDANSFNNNQLAHQDYNLTTAAALNHNLDLSAKTSHDNVSVGSISGQSVDLGKGWDRLEVKGAADHAVIKATGATGDSGDAAHTDMKEIYINGDLRNSSSITLGDGHDSVHVHNVSNSSVTLGAGDDHLYINGTVTAAQLHGGAGMDVLNLDAAHNLGGASDGLQDLNLSRLFNGSGAVLDGFEAIDLSGSHANMLEIGNINLANIDTSLVSSKLDATGHAQGLDTSAQHTLRITGDAEDSVHLDSSWKSTPAANITYDGVIYHEYNHATDPTHHLLIQQEIKVITG